MSKLTAALTAKKALIGFVVAGDPSCEATVENILALAQGGADVIEIGIPFSDPVADGPVIAAADQRALDRNVTTDDVFDVVSQVREQSDVPLVFLTYVNPVFQVGYREFCRRCTALGVDGLIIPDLPYEEQDDLRSAMQDLDLDLIQLVTPNSKARIPKIAQRAQGFVYVVSATGVTGMRNDFEANLAGVIAELRQYTKLPIEIGFGIHTPEQAHEMSQLADGVIVGSQIVDLIHRAGAQAPAQLIDYAQEMKRAITE
ncbi:tryptophan synthase subunit alpha [Fructilactobacillus myrtifloralis]|uniref:Tryptophan synthase alpha chain n=1 Tax=Fructilactobacillus myrtifloralis TaxID=2940301 RepID=A0ABY5BT96_9LACO|nr:tryptophan synthase subunit alpha [Fructilactobacillus myrtifloralis]USS85584.1 tryptophan synthase subunit alpha [Fructilactobacillus myrtifloralis]